MRYVLIAIAFLCAACSLFDDYGPCPSAGGSTPAPGPSPEPPYGPGVPGDNGADRYRKLEDGTVCVCGAYEVGCYETPEGADGSKACSYGPEGQMCDDYVRHVPPSEAAPDAEELSARKWTCPIGKYDRATRKLTEELARTERASSKSDADSKARAWADRKNESDKVYWWALIGSGCEPTEGDASE